jgi:hypothetical protein
MSFQPMAKLWENANKLASMLRQPTVELTQKQFRQGLGLAASGWAVWLWSRTSYQDRLNVSHQAYNGLMVAVDAQEETLRDMRKKLRDNEYELSLINKEFRRKANQGKSDSE